ncbi:helix-turn-helix domain-containing protein [Pigmentiphaga daeguensis]
MRTKLATSLGVPQILISQWALEQRRVPAERCPTIERATDGAVRCEDLRPDVDWAYLRQSAAPTPEPTPAGETSHA